MMNKLELFEPAMCCNTGVCGPSVNEDLLMMTSAIQALNTVEGYEAIRYNLSSSPQEFVNNATVTTILQEELADALPITLVNGEVKKKGACPTLDEISTFMGIQFVMAGSADGSCCGGAGSDCC